MAKYRFVCESCGLELEKYVATQVEKIPCERCADATMKRQFPNIGLQKVTEVVDKFTNVRHEEDHNQKLKARRTDYFWTVEVPRLIQQYSLQTCLEEGWLVYNDKGELAVGKPPSKR